MEQPVGTTNASLIPTAAMDILLAVPRLAQRAGSFAFFHMPEAMDNMAGKIFNGGSMIADATGQQTANSTITNTSNAFAQSTAAALDAAFREAWTEGGDDTTSSVFGMMLQGLGRLKSFGGMFSYLTSRWALATLTAVSISWGCLWLRWTPDLTWRRRRLSSSIVLSSMLPHASICD